MYVCMYVYIYIYIMCIMLHSVCSCLACFWKPQNTKHSPKCSHKIRLRACKVWGKSVLRQPSLWAKNILKNSLFHIKLVENAVLEKSYEIVIVNHTKMLLSRNDRGSFLWVHHFYMTFSNLAFRLYLSQIYIKIMHFAYTFRKFTSKTCVLPIPFANLYKNHAFCLYPSQIYINVSIPFAKLYKLYIFYQYHF